MFNYSFWADEAYLAGISSGLFQNKLSITEAFAALNYQKLYILLVATSFKIFGVSEFSARIPSLIFFILGIAIIFLLARKISNTFGSILSTSLYAFSHLNLAYATQAKPYSLLETIALAVIYIFVCISSEKNKTKLIGNHLILFFLLTVVTLVHPLGILLWIVYLVHFVIGLRYLKVEVHKKYFAFYLLGFSILAMLSFSIFTQYSSFKSFRYNNTYQVIKLFFYKYNFITVSAIIGFIWSFKENKNISIGIFFYVISVKYPVFQDHFLKLVMQTDRVTF